MSLRSLVLVPLAAIIVTFLLVARVLYHSTEPAAVTAAPEPKMMVETVHPELIADPSVSPELADAPGKDVFLANCLNCHTARYVTMQPRFPRKVWQAEVTKMVAAYKAPVTPAQQTEIVNYLVAGYGTQSNASK